MQEEFKEGDKVFIRWYGGNSGDYTLVKGESHHSHIWYTLDMMGNINYNAGKVFEDTESVELL
jgi:hypothetical protein